MIAMRLRRRSYRQAIKRRGKIRNLAVPPFSLEVREGVWAWFHIRRTLLREIFLDPLTWRAQATVYTGCLTMGGNVNKVAEGIEKWEK